jgi:hypothetical protein
MGCLLDESDSSEVRGKSKNSDFTTAGTEESRGRPLHIGGLFMFWYLLISACEA